MKIIDFIKWSYYDFKNPRPKVPDEFIIFVGKKGVGKSVSLQYHQSIVRDMYDVPVHLFANYKSKYCDEKILLTAEDIMLTPPNSVIYIDEANEKFDSQDWKDLPKILKKLITQNRHLNKTIIMGAQRFNDINKRFRDKFDYVIEVTNFKNRWIWWHAYKREHYLSIAKTDDEGKIIRNQMGEDIIEQYKGDKIAWRQSFIATNELYNSYDDKELVFGL
ncbi:MAG: ATP-binding protein [Candidatus Andersenbacteria bacterium]|nr:ATP-binding protein [Candidatus Andersenbacteria bacterium]